MTTYKKRLLQGESIELTNSVEDDIFLFLGHQKRFCLQLNGRVLLSVKTFKPIENKLISFFELKEV